MNIKKHYTKGLNLKNTKKHSKYIANRKKEYEKGIYLLQKPILKSYKNKESKHVLNVKKKYNINFTPKEIELATGVTIQAQKEIIKKGKGAFFTSGSRPNQTPDSWAKARLASVILKKKCYKIDKHILDKYNIKIKLPKKEKIKYCDKANEKKNSKCIRKKDGKIFDLPRKFSRKKCKTSMKGFTMKSSCAPFL